MTRRAMGTSLTAAFALVLMLAVSSQAHSGGEETGLSVEPDSLQAGGTVVLVGTGLESNDTRTLALVGPDITVDLGTVTSDADGMFQIQLTIPGHLPAGSYELRAIGDEILTVPLALTAAEGTGTATTGAGQEMVVPHAWDAADLAILVLAVLGLLAVGLFLIRFAEQIGRVPPRSEVAPIQD